MDVNQSYKIKKAMFGVILVILTLPAIQGFTDYFELEPLKGAVNTVNDVTFGKDIWLSGEYQFHKEKYLKHNFGFRSTLVRLNNQKQYSLYNKTNAKNVVVGKEEYLYEENYIHAYMGNNFVGEEKVKKNVLRLSEVTKGLKAMGKDVVFILAPGKATFFPEYIPDEYGKKSPDAVTNYDQYLKEFKNQGINYIDFNNWFLENKGKKDYPLYAKCGIHWSKYAEIIVADSLIKYIENLRQIDLPDLVLDTVILSEENKYEDYDIGNGMNLLNSLSTYSMGYPQFHFEKTASNTFLNSIVVADSYYWGMFNYGVPANIFNEHHFWYYNNQVYPDSYNGKSVVVGDLKIKEVIENNDLFFLLFTDANLHNFDYGFTDLVYQELFGLSGEEKQERIDFYINKIKNTPDWLESIKSQASKEGKTLDEMIKINAEYMVKTVG